MLLIFGKTLLFYFILFLSSLFIIFYFFIFLKKISSIKCRNHTYDPKFGNLGEHIFKLKIYRFPLPQTDHLLRYPTLF
jgi:hypothetical protein